MSLPSPGPAPAHRSAGDAGPSSPASGLRVVANKVPEITVWFWVAKLLTTGMGETTWDWAAIALGPVPAICLSGLGFVVALALQLRERSYRPWAYWSAVLMVSVFGTTCADAVHVVLGLPYMVSTVAVLLAALVAFGIWYRVEVTLSIHAVDTRRRELFSWAAVVMTFALGTALGDFTASTLGLGYAASIVIFGVLFAVPFLVARWTPVSEMGTFWFAYVMTRPFGASVADWVGVPPARGGVGIGGAAPPATAAEGRPYPWASTAQLLPSSEPEYVIASPLAITLGRVPNDPPPATPGTSEVLTDVPVDRVRPRHVAPPARPARGRGPPTAGRGAARHRGAGGTRARPQRDRRPGARGSGL